MLRDLGPVETPAPQAYDVACPNGHRLQGLRNEGYQALRCPTCGEGIFVLPRSPLPDANLAGSNGRPEQLGRRPVEEDAGPIPLVDPPQGRTLADDEDEANIEWVDEAEPAEEIEVPYEEELAARRALKEREKRKVEEEDEEEEEEFEAEEGSERQSWGVWARRKRPALVLTAVLILVAATLGLSIRRARLKEYPRWVERGRTEGIEALDRGEFDKARMILSRAREGVDSLGGEIEGADAIRQAAAEADLIANLVPKTLEDILDEAARYPDADDWPGHFRSMYKGRSIVVDSTVRREGRAGGLADKPADLDYRVLSRGPGGPRVARISLQGVVLFENLNLRAGDRVVFGARLESLSPEGDGSGWVFTLEPNSAGVMTHLKALSALGFTDSEDRATGGR